MNTQKKQSFKSMEDNFPLFLAGAVIGWIYEVLLNLFATGTFVNRGMLHGPWLPIYGTGCILMVQLKKLIGNKTARYFIACTAISGVLEYITSWLLESIYHKRWWDYSELPLNLNGRIFVGGLVGFGVAGCLFTNLIIPIMEKKYKTIPPRIRNGFEAILKVIFILDMLVSLFFPNDIIEGKLM